MFSFFSFRNNLAMIGLIFLLDSITSIILSNTTNRFLFLVGLKSSKFSKILSIVCK